MRHVHDMFAVIERSTVAVARSGRSAVCVPRRHRRSWSPYKRRVLHPRAPGLPDAHHALVHDLRAAHARWPKGAFEGLPERLAVARCVFVLRARSRSRLGVGSAAAYALRGWRCQLPLARHAEPPAEACRRCGVNMRDRVRDARPGPRR